MDILSNFSENLSELISDKNLTAKSFAEEVGIDRSGIYKYLRKEVLPSIQNLLTVADYFECSADYLLGLVSVNYKSRYKKAPPFCECFKMRLKNKGLTRYKFLLQARSQNMRFAKQSVDDWYNGKRLPSVDNAVALSKFFDCTLDELLGRE